MWRTLHKIWDTNSGIWQYIVGITSSDDSHSEKGINRRDIVRYNGINIPSGNQTGQWKIHEGSWLVVYPSEKYESVGMTFPTGKSFKIPWFQSPGSVSHYLRVRISQPATWDFFGLDSSMICSMLRDFLVKTSCHFPRELTLSPLYRLQLNP